MLRSFAYVILPTVFGCTPFGAEERVTRRVPAIIDFYYQGTTDVLVAPDTVSANAPFQVHITSFAGGCEKNGGVDVSVSQTQAILVVFDSTVSGPNVACPDILLRLKKTVTVTLPTAGAGELVVRGRRVGPETGSAGVERSLVKKIHVRGQ